MNLKYSHIDVVYARLCVCVNVCGVKMHGGRIHRSYASAS